MASAQEVSGRTGGFFGIGWVPGRQQRKARRALGRAACAIESLEQRTLLSMVEFASINRSFSEHGGTVTLLVQLSSPGDLDVTVPLSVGGGTATGNGTDYSLSGDSILIPAGQSSGSISLTIVNDATAEGNETVLLTLGMPTNAILGFITSQTVTILDDDVPAAVSLPVVSISDATVMEGDSGTVDMVFTVTRQGDLTPEITVGYTTSDWTSGGGIGYTPQTGTVTIPAGESTATIRVPVLGDEFYEWRETYAVQLTTDRTGYHEFDVGTIPPDPSLPWAVATGDFNGDGKMDLAVANFNIDRVSVLLNTAPAGASKPSFAAAADFVVGSNGFGSGGYSLSVADFNGDDRPDLAVSHDQGVSVLRNTTVKGANTPRFAAKVHLATPDWLQSVIATSDINGDGKMDLVVSYREFDASKSRPVSVLLNTTAPGAAAISFAASQNIVTGLRGTTFVAVGDIDSDGKPDLAVSDYDSDTVVVLLNTTASGAATASFAAKQEFTQRRAEVVVGYIFYEGAQWTRSCPGQIAIGDINGDGKPDLVGSGSVLLNTTPGGAATASFTTQNIDTGPYAGPVTVGDINGDGMLDVVLTNWNYMTASVLLNTTVPGAGTVAFSAPAVFATGNTKDCPAPVSSGVAIGDFTGDGIVDIAMTNPGGDSVVVFTPEMLTPDAWVTFDDLGIGRVLNDDRDRQPPEAEITTTPVINAATAAMIGPVRAAMSKAATAPVIKGKKPAKFTVTYRDAGKLNVKSIDSKDILVTGPRGFSQMAKLVKRASAGDARRTVATYQITAPGGSWNKADNGTYTIWLKPKQVRDATGNSARKKVKLGKFTVGPRSTRVASAPPAAAAALTAPATTLSLFSKKAIATRRSDEILN